jgi:hypothetical protein
MPDNKPAHDAVDIALELSRYFSEHHHEYALGGALALGYWAAPRGTVDLDVTLYLSSSDPDDCVSVLQDAGCELGRTDAMLSLREHGFCRVARRGFQVDVFMPTIPFYELAKSRRRCVLLDGQTVYIWDAETLCVFKMMFFRLKDLADVEQILRVQQQLDRRWVHNQLVQIYGDRDPRITRWNDLIELVNS